MRYAGWDKSNFVDIVIFIEISQILYDNINKATVDFLFACVLVTKNNK